ncbi:MAG TPA: M20/M25/M40 family metallo-hydrolase [Saprospiraceae bacterium]|nr:M20/M25/M40 family metallo-hydrolase [Saprospiraceae bacterium]
MKVAYKSGVLYSSVLTIMFLLNCSPKVRINGGGYTSVEILKSDVVMLASDEFEGREVGTPGEYKAALFISGRMSDIGLQPVGVDGYWQYFSKRMKANPHSQDDHPDDKVIEGRNVIGLLDNGSDQYVVIGAHYDHLGYGEQGSLHSGERAIHHGADDNASGVAILLNLASKLADNGKKEHYNYLFIAFSGEEKGLWGSNFFVKNPPFELDKINYMINMDMVGRLNHEKSLAVHGTGTSSVFPAILSEYNRYGFDLILSESGVGPSDHTSFYLENIPVLHFFTGQHADYHKPSDTPEKLNYAGMMAISDYIYDLIIDLDKSKKLPFIKTKDESRDSPRFQVTLGVIPDYLYQGKGMRVDGVREGKPAYIGGLVKGDIIVKMDDLDIVDMMTYMEALAHFSSGQSIAITILRGNEPIIKTLTFD